mmetsp:Transcript_81520/g.230859  ORF Transcript_81520/g.230859 Transcript_81520/m.230859 type:complete len:205 (+) Transcript_81520:81-695(+)
MRPGGRPESDGAGADPSRRAPALAAVRQQLAAAAEGLRGLERCIDDGSGRALDAAAEAVGLHDLQAQLEAERDAASAKAEQLASDKDELLKARAKLESELREARSELQETQRLLRHGALAGRRLADEDLAREARAAWSAGGAQGLAPSPGRRWREPEVRQLERRGLRERAYGVAEPGAAPGPRKPLSRHGSAPDRLPRVACPSC